MKFNLKTNFKTRHASIAALTTLVLVALLIILNLIVQRESIQFDMTRKKLFSLTDETKTLVSNLEEPINIYLLSKIGEEPKDILEVLERYKKLSKDINVQIVDPDREPAIIAPFKEEGEVLSPGSVIVSNSRFHRTISRIDLYSISYNQQGKPQVLGMTVEQRVSSAISYVATGYEPKIYSLIGHNETSFKKLNMEDLIHKNNFLTKELNLTVQGAVPSDASILAIISPKRDIAPLEREAIEKYLKSGGTLYLALDLQANPFKEFEALLENYNLKIEQGIVMEKEASRLLPGLGNNPLFFAPRLDKESPITKPMIENNLDAFLFTPMAITQTESQKRNLKYTALMTSSKSSFLRTNLKNGSESISVGDLKGPMTLAASIAQTNRDTGKEKGAKIVLLSSGKSLGAMPGLGQIKANIEFTINSFKWLSQQENSVQISSKSLFRLPLRLSALQAWIYAGICVVLIPLLIGIIGFIIIFRRKHL